MATALEMAQRSMNQAPSQPSLTSSSQLYSSPSYSYTGSSTMVGGRPIPVIVKQPELIGPTKPTLPEKPKYLETPGLKETGKPFITFLLPSKEFLGGVFTGAKTLYEPFYTPIKRGLSNFMDAYRPGTEAYEDKKEGERLLKAGAKEVAKGIFIEQTIEQPKAVVRGLQMIYQDPQILSPKRQLPLVVATTTAVAPSVRSYVQKFLTSPATRGEATFYALDLFAPTGLLKGARAGDKLIRTGIVRLGAKEVPSTELFASQLFKNGKLSSTGIATTKESSSILSLFEKTKGKIKEYPEYLVAQSSLQAPLKDSKILTQAEKGMSGLKTRLEDPGFWVSPRGEGGTFYFRLAEEGTTPKYKFSLFPDTQKTGKPELLQILGKRAEALPDSVLFKDVGFKTVAEYQDFLAKIRPSTFIIPKRSEIAIGSRETKSLIKSIDPKARGSPEIQAVIPQGVFLEEATKIKPRNFLSRLKGYSEFVKVGSESIPIRYKIVSEATDLIGDVKSVASKGKQTITDALKKQADEFYSYYQSTKRPVYTIDVGRPASYGYFAASRPNYTQTSFTGTDPVYGGIKDKPSYAPTNLKPTDYSIGKLFNNDYIPPPPPGDDDYLPPPPRDDDYPTKPTYDPTEFVLKYPTKPTYDPTEFVLKYPTKPTLPGYTFTPKPPKTPPAKRLSYTVDMESYTKPKNLNQAFDVFVRTKGKWTKVKTNETMNYYSAKQKGFEIADNYAERSVKLKPTNKKAQRISYAEPFNAYKFTWDKSKKENLRKTYIEKPTFAIDTIGELKGITYKGLQAKKSKKQFSFL